MLCVLPTVDASDLSINIQHKLIEAYCWENSVNVVKVRKVCKHGRKCFKICLDSTIRV